MAKRKIIEIDEEKCNGCGLCMPNCPEGALQMIDGKARLVSDLFCDGLGACIGHCPQGAISVVEREAGEYDERRVMENIVKQGANTIAAHLKHLKDHQQEEYYQQAVAFLKERGISVPKQKVCVSGGHGGGCPGAKVMDFSRAPVERAEQSGPVQNAAASRLRQWPVQLGLVPAFAPYLNNSDLLIAADCVPFAYAGFHENLLKDKIVLVGCPKFDDLDAYGAKLEQVFRNNTIKSVTYAHMEVPCCSGLIGVIRQAIDASGKEIPFHDRVISIRGELL
jgi:ferredoxin